MAIGIDPKVDFAFHLLLGNPDHPEVTLHFLNSIFRGQPRITQVRICNPIIGKKFTEDKFYVLDVRAIDNHGQYLNIEIQTSLPAGFPGRLTVYAASGLVKQLGSGDGYHLLRPSISICVLDVAMFHEISDFYSEFRLRTRDGLEFTDCLQIHLLELPKYAYPGDNEVIVDPIEQWVFFFRHAQTLTADELVRRLPNPAFAEATGILEMIARTPEERQLYEDRVKAIRDEISRQEYSLAEGHRRGLEEGREKGRKEGRKEGLEKGEVIGRVHLLQQLLGLQETPRDQLRDRSLSDLAALAQTLQQQLRSRG